MKLQEYLTSQEYSHKAILRHVLRMANSIVVKETTDANDLHKPEWNQVDAAGSRFLFVSAAMWPNLVCDERILMVFDPVTRIEVLMRGLMGTLYAREVYTDAYLEPSARSLIKAPSGIAVMDLIHPMPETI